MKRTLYSLAALILCVCSMSAKKASGELASLKAFLQQPAMEAATNAEALGISNLNDPSSWTGVVISNGHVKEIKWDGKKLAGSLTLSNMPELTSVMLRNNRLVSLSISNCPALTAVNAGRNRISQFSCTGTPMLQNLLLYRNRLSSIDLGAVPMLKRLNISSNSMAALDVCNAANLETLNCSSNRMEELAVSGCKNLKTSMQASMSLQA